ncbi:hypothetical protein SLG_29220 [Sphingobium sp. SYK-6]|uniref:DUF1810 domain-containing protein n=1 Tax=Sphingobium sp. (strain NBRC 103272 / SYK-6) TaxID=627192 RepID=UPI000227726E|nr:DUF1810 domain-containing protein [Sphingobium sp. SYK-6]BAK67597.1 hypothetical protein SLG_29220 [Sphingobium sp. SYK-6]
MTDDPALDRFLEAQASVYPHALAEIRSGAKRSHWMWFVFPQIAGLGHSPAARHFAIRSRDEARAFLNHPVLGPRYHECVRALEDLRTGDPVAVFGEIDAMKLRSSLTLFEAVRPDPSIAAVLDRWFGGVRDPLTLRLLGISNG